MLPEFIFLLPVVENKIEILKVVRFEWENLLVYKDIHKFIEFSSVRNKFFPSLTFGC